jgi:hypothetical protein
MKLKHTIYISVTRCVGVKLIFIFHILILIGKSLEKLSLDELDELEDDEEEAILREYKQKRLMEMKADFSKARYGEVIEITAQDYVQEVNKAGEGVWVVVHLYKQA